MRSISIISKLTGVTNNTEASEFTLTAPSIVELKAERSDIASIVRSNQDMVITLRDGEVITVKNFYAFADQGGNQLVLEDNKGTLWWVQDTDSAFHFEHINNIDELMTATGAESHGGAAIWPWVLGGVAVAGGIALAAGGGGGGGGGSDHSNNGGNPDPAPPTADTTPPAAPTNLSVSADGKMLTGSAEPGSTVTITDSNGQVIGQGTAGSDGNFSIPLTTPQINGEDLTAHATDPSGNTGPDATVVAPDIPLPDAPALTSVVDDVSPVTGTVPNTQSTNDNTPTLQGTGQAGTTVHIYDNGVEIGSVVVGASSSWSYTPATALPDGSHTFTVTATNEKGESGPSASYAIIIDTVAPDAPELNQLRDNTGLLTGAIGNGDRTDETRPGLNGTGEPGNNVTIFDNGIQVGQATVGDDGKWNFTPSQPLADGTHTITLVQTDAAGNVSKETTSPTFVVDHTPPAAAVIDSVNPTGTMVTGHAESGNTITIFDANNVLLGTVQVGSDGNFTVNITPAQTHGESLTAHIQDAAGNVGPDTPFNASNSQFPTVPELDTVTDDAGVTVGPLNNGQSTDDTTPTLSGTAEAGNTVAIYDNGLLIGSVVADGTGNWSFTPTALPDGPHVFTLTATNAFGTSGTSAGFTVTVDTMAPSAPSNMLVSDDGLHVTGSAEPNGKITITDGSGNVLGTGVTGSDGRFDVTPLSPAQINGQTLLVTATDAADNKSDTAAAFAPDHIAPDAPTNVHINDEGTVVTGNAEAGSTVTVSDSNGNPLGSSQAGSDGSFSVTIAPAQTNGETLEVSAKDNAGNVGPNTPVDAPDTTAPGVPVITHVIDDVANHTGDLTNGQTTNDDKPTLQGTAEAGSTINIYDNGGTTLIGTVTADAGGNWSFTPATSLGQGLHNLTVTATDAHNNTSPATSFSVVVDTIAPQAPTITLVNDDASPITGPVQNNGSTNDQTPTIHGTGEPGSTITLLDGTTVLTTLTVDSSGTWTYTPTNPLPVGDHTFTVTAEDAAGNVTAPSSEFTINVDIAAPTTPVITTVQDDVGTIEGSLAPNAATDDTQPQVNGTGDPGSTITLYDGTTAVGSAQVGLDGKWSITPSQPLSEGPHTLNAIATDAAGNASTAATYNLTVDTTPPAAPFILTAEGNVSGNPATLTSGGSTQSSAPTLTGSGEPGATINIYDNAGTTPIGTVIVPVGGTWTFTPTLAEGSHTLTAVATDPAGNVGLPSAGFALTVDSTAPTAPGIPTVTDDQAPGLGAISNGSSTNDTTPTISGTGGTAGDTITILDNGTSIGTTTVRADGSWSFTPQTPITGADHAISVTESDQAGNKSPASGTVAFTLDTTPPDAPTIITADDNVGAVQAPLGTGSVTDDNTPTFHGTGQNGDTITLYSGNTVIGTATVAGGVWEITSTPLSDGMQNITATATDAAGNISAPSADFALTVYTTPLTAPAVTDIVDNVGVIQTPLVNGSYTDDTTPTINGTGTAGSTISIYDNGGTTPIGTAVVQA
ncbi:MAG TPA: Ig-like domain-containing protein, partial [Buttiauxella sp.]